MRLLKGHPALTEFKWKLVGLFGKLFLDGLFATVRIEFFGFRQNRRLMNTGRFVGAFWHSRVLLPSYLFQRQKAGVLVSQSDDGEIISRILKHQGYETIRGSSTRGGLRALSRLIRYAGNEKNPLVITPDGPQGPRFRAQPGIITLARRTGYPIIPIAYSARRIKVFASWDRFILPLPFTTCRIGFGRPVRVPPDADKKEVKRCLARLEQELCRITFDLDQSFGHRIR